MADDERDTHIFRVLGKTTDGAGNVIDEPDAWLDLERFEYYRTVEGSGPDYQVINYKLKWYEDDAGTVPNPSRTTSTLKIIPPDEDAENPSFWWEVEVNDEIQVRDHDQLIKVRFDNSSDNQRRKVAVRRIVHYDTTADDNYPNGGKIPKHEYKNIRSTKDEDQYVDIEIIKKRGFRDFDQVYSVTYNNDLLIELAETPDTVYAEGEINPPWRLDPLQNIVNVKYPLTDQQWLLGAALGPVYTATAADETTYPGIKTGASGLGVTVMTSGMIAFGTLTMPDDSRKKCFLRSSGSTVFIGEMIDGELTWAPVFTAGSDIIAISFANDKFFVTHYETEDSTTTSLAVTSDGASFSVVNPFASVSEAYCGGVAYSEDLEVYVTAGANGLSESPGGFLRTDTNLVTATSADGLGGWSATLHGSVFAGIGGGNFLFSNVACGNGVFVAAAGQKHVFETTLNGEPTDEPDYVLHSAAVAVSSNGVSWSVVPLPGAVVRSSFEQGDRASDGMAVVFVKDKESGDGDGYFVATGSENGGVEFISKEMMWRSTDGFSWTLIRDVSEDALVTNELWDVLSVIKKNLDPSTIVSF